MEIIVKTKKASSKIARRSSLEEKKKECKVGGFGDFYRNHLATLDMNAPIIAQTP
jgi:hypothetical protein